MNNNLDEQEYRQVYAGICAVAAHCDGAATLDAVGFDGQDTHFGRRIAAVPFEAWTDDVKAEAARIARKYQRQIAEYTGVDVTTLGVVKAATAETNRAARDTARRYEREAKAQGLKAHRKAQMVDGRIALSWHSKDPDCFNVLVPAVRSLPGRRYSSGVNYVDVSIEALDFIEAHGPFETTFDVDALRNDLLAKQAPPTPVVASDPAIGAMSVEEWNAQVAASRNCVTLEGDRVRIRFDYNAEMVAAVRALPGRQYDGASKSNTADVSADVVAFAERFGLPIDPAIVAKVEAEHGERAEALNEEAMFIAVSRMADPADLPAAFVERFLKVVA